MVGSASRKTEVLTLYQFQKLSKVQYGNTTNVIKADFDILYKNAIRRSQAFNENSSPTSSMDLYVFMEALELLSMKLFPPHPVGGKDSSITMTNDGLRQLLDCAIQYFENSGTDTP